MWISKHQEGIFGDIRGIWIADETLSQMFDTSSHSNQELRVNGEVKSWKSMLIKTVYPNVLHGCDFLCFYLINLMSLKT